MSGTVTRLEPMHVTRVPTDRGTRPEPPYDPDWSRTDQARWMAGIAAHDSGLHVAIQYHARRDYYNVEVGHSTSGPFEFGDIRGYLNGVVVGAQQPRQQIAGEGDT